MEQPASAVATATLTATATATATASAFSSMAQFAHSVLTYPCRVEIKRCKVIDADGLRYRKWEIRTENRRLAKKALKKMRPKERKKNYKLALDAMVIVKRDYHLDVSSRLILAKKDQSWKKKVADMQRKIGIPINPKLRDNRIYSYFFACSSGPRKMPDHNLDVLQRIYGSGCDTWSDAIRRHQEDTAVLRKLKKKAAPGYQIEFWKKIRFDGVPHQEYVGYLDDPLRFTRLLERKK